MRLWHKSLISVLPREQLIAQWRELSAIAGAIKKNGTPNHLLVNFVMDYDYDHFINYAASVQCEMYSRGYHPSDAVWKKIESLKPDWYPMGLDAIYPKKMNQEYLTICYYNLYEKFLCGGIKQDWWDLIKGRVYWRCSI